MYKKHIFVFLSSWVLEVDIRLNPHYKCLHGPFKDAQSLFKAPSKRHRSSIEATASHKKLEDVEDDKKKVEQECSAMAAENASLKAALNP